eukprot:GAHX01000856.1.p1 GENE.GAHX01000856.1~~GAHX01000856.1.p1  ORF type:complete len:386 (-),score=65.53 GAHX01000856.1:1340-2497(-)
MESEQQTTTHSNLYKYTHWITNESISLSLKLKEGHAGFKQENLDISSQKASISYTHISKRKIRLVDILGGLGPHGYNVLLFESYDNSLTLAILDSSYTMITSESILTQNNSNIVHLELIDKEGFLLFYSDGSIITYHFKLKDTSLETMIHKTIVNPFVISLVVRVDQESDYFFMYIDAKDIGKCLVLYHLVDNEIIKRVVFNHPAKALYLSKTKALLGITFDDNFVILDTRDFSLLQNGKGKKLFYSPSIISLTFHNNGCYFSTLKKGNKIDIFDLQKGYKVKLHKRILTKDFKCNQLLEYGGELVMLNKNYQTKAGYFVKYVLGDNIEEIVVDSDSNGKEILGKVYSLVKLNESNVLVGLTDDRKILIFQTKTNKLDKALLHVA